MKLAELKERIAKWEDLHTDFKERFDSNRELAKDLVCFANTDGGQIIFGISSDKHIVGVDDPDWLFNKVDDIAFQRKVTSGLTGLIPVSTIYERHLDAARHQGKNFCAFFRLPRVFIMMNPPCLV
jgi:hypothetical protein